MKPFYSKKGKEVIIVYQEKKKKRTRTLPKAEILLTMLRYMKKGNFSKGK